MGPDPSRSGPRHPACHRSIDRLSSTSGATALNNDQALQRFWRDAHAGRVHAANDAERACALRQRAVRAATGDTMV